MNRSPGGSGSTIDMAKSLYSTLSRDQMRSLLELYKFDFEAFGYDWKAFDNLELIDD